MQINSQICGANQIGEDTGRLAGVLDTMVGQVPRAGEFDIVGELAIREPHAYFGMMREIAPVLWDERSRSWIVTGYAEVTGVLRDDRHFSSDRIRPFIARKLSGSGVDPKVRAAFDLLADWLVFNDKPRHLRLRKLINQAFMSEAMAKLTSRFAALFEEVIAQAPQSGHIDILADIALPFSASVISAMLGVPEQDRDRFAEWHRLFGPVVGASLEDPNKYDSLAEGVSQLADYVRGLIAHYREAPEDNLLSALIKAHEDDEALTEEEIVATCTLVLFAGSETTANLIANSILALIRDPSQMELLRSGQVEIADAVEEFLRFDGSGKAVTRVVREDNAVLGVPMKAGQRVFLILAAANHDPAVFEHPDQLHLDRSSDRKHIAFGYGLHSCMGLQLARLEAAIAIPGILGKYGHIQLAGGLDWHPQLLSRGLKALPVLVGR